MPSITTSIVVDFAGASGGDYHLSAEVDSREGGFNGGLTSFPPAYSPVFLVFFSDNVLITGVEATVPGVNFTVEQDVLLLPVVEYPQFPKTLRASLSKPVHSGFDYKWLGNDLGVLAHSYTSVSIPDAGLGIAKVSYFTRCRAYRMNGVPETLNGEVEFPIMVYITGVPA